MEKLDAAQLDQLKEIGAHLQQVRQSQSRSLEEIATKTCIRLPLLQALEAGHGQVLPEPVFVQGFIRRYADLLGLDGTSLARTFFVNRGMVINPEPPIKSSAEPAYLAPPRVAPLQKAKFSESKFAESKPLESKPAESKFAPLSSAFGQEGRSLFQSKGAYAVYALLAALTLGGIVRSFFTAAPSPVTAGSTTADSTASSPTIAKPPAPSVKPAAPSPAAQVSPTFPVEIASPTPSPSPESAAISNAPVSVAMRFIDAAWVQVLVDGQVDYEGTLPKGTTRTWSAKRQITVLSGNAGAVSLSANNGASKLMGSLGDVKELTVTAKN